MINHKKPCTQLGSKTASGYIDALNIVKNWKLQHAYNGGEISCGNYYMDGYDSENGIVFEYDEQIHRSRRQKELDLRKQHYIIDYFNSIGKPLQFWRYSAYEKQLYQVF